MKYILACVSLYSLFVCSNPLEFLGFCLLAFVTILMFTADL